MADTTLFPPIIIAAAQDCETKFKLPACITLVQWALESGYGHSTPPNSFNPFGMKWFTGCKYGYVETMTKEYRKGQWVIERWKFIKFPNYATAFVEHAKLLMYGRPYQKAVLLLPDWSAFLGAISNVYASDPTYEQKCRKIIKANKLNAYNAPSVDKVPKVNTLVEVRRRAPKLKRLGARR